MKKGLFLNGSHLKIIAAVLMLVDHIAYHIIPPTMSYWIVLRQIGRLSFPLFAFLIVEGVLHSRHKVRYIIQLLILEIVVSLGQVLFLNEYTGNVMMTLACGALTIYFLEKKSYQSLFAVFPVAFILLCTNLAPWFPFKADYDLYGLLIILGFYAAYLINNLIGKYNCQKYDVDFDGYKETSYYQKLRNIVSFALLLGINFIFYFLNPSISQYIGEYGMGVQVYAVFSGIIILFYSGKRGFNKPWFKWGFYLFYPLQFILVYLLGLVIHL